MTDKWANKTREAKLASVLFPSLTNEITQREMARLSGRERKQAPRATPLLDHRSRGPVSPLGGAAKS
jgi:hypothetical protein